MKQSELQVRKAISQVERVIKEAEMQRQLLISMLPRKKTKKFTEMVSAHTGKVFIPQLNTKT